MYSARPSKEYTYLCKHLGGINVSLTDTLERGSKTKGVVVEAALEYYESLRMARIVNRTWFDPHTLNVDIDGMKSDYTGAVRSILRHIGYSASAEEIDVVAKELDFFDYASSPLYRWSVSNPLFSHIDKARVRDDKAYNEEKLELMSALRTDADTEALYQPILQMMHYALRK